MIPALGSFADPQCSLKLLHSASLASIDLKQTRKMIHSELCCLFSNDGDAKDVSVTATLEHMYNTKEFEDLLKDSVALQVAIGATDNGTDVANMISKMFAADLTRMLQNPRLTDPSNHNVADLKELMRPGGWKKDPKAFPKSTGWQHSLGDPGRRSDYPELACGMKIE